MPDEIIVYQSKKMCGNEIICQTKKRGAEQRDGLFHRIALKVRTRFAPTPSGYLHRGNLANAQINAWLAQQIHGDLVLRIDADDRARCQPQYSDFIVASLRELGIAYTLYAPDIESRKEYLKSELKLIPRQNLFACDCSRSSLIEQECSCREQSLAWQPGVNALRLHLDPDLTATVNGELFRLHDEFGDVVLWRRDDIPAYHWANVIDDRDLGISHIVRGRDLLASSALHIHIASMIGAVTVAKAQYHHHSLLVDSTGKKLSKSQQSNAQPPTLDLTFLSDVRTSAQELADELGIAVP